MLIVGVLQNGVYIILLICTDKMATESPIRMIVPRGKWSSSPVNVAMDENGLPVSQYQSGNFNAPNRSGSAPPSMEGSLAAMGTLMHSHNLQGPVRSVSDDRLFDDSGTVSNNRTSRGILPTHTEESEDDTSPPHQHAYNDWTGGNSPMLSEQDLSKDRSFVDQTQV